MRGMVVKECGGGGDCLKNIGHGSRLGARQIKNGERLAVNR